MTQEQNAHNFTKMRSIFRVVEALLAYYIIIGLSPYVEQGGFIFNVFSATFSIFLMYGYLSWMGLRDGLSRADLRMPPPRLSWRAIFLSAIAVSTLLIPLSLSGYWVQHPEYSKADISNMIIYTILMNGIRFAILEEMAFRGYMQSVMERSYGQWPACVAINLLFAILHMGQVTRMGFLAVLVIFLMGVLNAILALQNGHIWDNVLLHCVWNIFVARRGILFVGNSMSEHTMLSYVTNAKMPIPLCLSTATTEPQIYHYGLGLVGLMLFVLWALSGLQRLYRNK